MASKLIHHADPSPAQPALSLGQTNLSPNAWLYFALLIVLCVIGFVIIMAVRRRIFNDKDRTDTSAGLMSSLDEMRRTGEISQDEYDRTRRRIVERTLEQLQDDRVSEGQDKK